MCKGTTNWEDVYIIPMDKIPKETIKYLNVFWISNHGGIPVDKCIGEEMETLITDGVVTVGSCCGHGNYFSHALILDEYRALAESLGYFVESFRFGLSAVILKNGTQKSETIGRGW